MGTIRTFIFLILSAWGMVASGQRTELSRKDTAEVQWIDGAKYYVYKVEKGETIYSITRRFKITEEELHKSNPALKLGLKNKMLLLIPSRPASKSAAAGIKAEEKKSAKKELNIAILLPVNAWKSMQPDSEAEDSVGKPLDDETLSQLEFYEGALHAVDSLASKNLKVHLRLLDTENDSSRVTTLLKDPRMKELDFMVAAGDPPVLRRLSQFSNMHRVGLLTFELNSSDVMKNNAFAYALSPSSVTQCYEAGKFCSRKFKGTNTLVLQSGTAKENERALAFGNGWNDHAELKCRSIDYSKGAFESLLASMVKGKNNLLFIPTSNEDFVNALVTRLNDTTDVYQVTVIGIPTWQYFGSTDPAVMENLNTHLFTASHLDYDDNRTIAFRKFFRREYMTEPSDAAFQGFDAIMLIGKSLLEPGREADPGEMEGLFSTYRFKTVNGLNENQYIRMVRYEGYQLVDVK